MSSKKRVGENVKDYISLTAVKSKPKKDFNAMIDAKVDSVKHVMHNYYL